MTQADAPTRPSWLLALAGLLIVLAGALLAHLVQTAGGIRIQDVRFTGSNGTPMSAYLYVPPNATAKTPAPGILAVHGYFNSREAQSGFAIEFARRGYVVLALDQTGHGYSAPPAFANAFGGIDGLKYLRSLDIVDKDNIGLEGHSMAAGRWSTRRLRFPTRTRRSCSKGPARASRSRPRARRSSRATWRSCSASTTSSPASCGRCLRRPTSPEAGSCSRCSEPAPPSSPAESTGHRRGNGTRAVHAGHHPPDGPHLPHGHRVQPGLVPAHAAGRNAPARRGPDLVLEGNGDAGRADRPGRLRARYIRPAARHALLRFPARPARGGRDGSTADPMVARARVWRARARVDLPATRPPGGALLPATPWLPQAFSNEIAFWAVCNALIVLAASFLPGTPKARAFDQPLRALALAAATFAVAYALVATVQFLFQVDFRFWFIAFKPMSRWQAAAFPVYLVAFAVFFTIALRSLHAVLSPGAATARGQYLVSFAALAGGFVLFLVVQYGLMFGTNRMIEFHMFDALRTIIAINFVPLMALVALVSTFAYRRTGRYLPGALLCAGLVAWYVVVGQATQAA